MISISKAAQLSMSGVDTAAEATLPNIFSHNVATLQQRDGRWRDCGTVVLKPFPLRSHHISPFITIIISANKVAKLLEKTILKRQNKEEEKKHYPHNADVPLGETQV